MLDLQLAFNQRPSFKFWLLLGSNPAVSSFDIRQVQGDVADLARHLQQYVEEPQSKYKLSHLVNPQMFKVLSFQSPMDRMHQIK